MANVPADLRYTKEHEWAKLEGDKARVGITAFAQPHQGKWRRQIGGFQCEGARAWGLRQMALQLSFLLYWE